MTTNTFAEALAELELRREEKFMKSDEKELWMRQMTLERKGPSLKTQAGEKTSRACEKHKTIRRDGLTTCLRHPGVYGLSERRVWSMVNGRPALMADSLKWQGVAIHVDDLVVRVVVACFEQHVDAGNTS